MAQKYRTLTIKAVRTNRGYVLKDEYNRFVDDGYVYPNPHDAYVACSKMYPRNSVWEGRKIAGGYRIYID